MVVDTAAALVGVDIAEVSAGTAVLVARVCRLLYWAWVCRQVWLEPEVCIGASVAVACTEASVAVAYIVAFVALVEVHK